MLIPKVGNFEVVPIIGITANSFILMQSMITVIHCLGAIINFWIDDNKDILLLS